MNTMDDPFRVVADLEPAMLDRLAHDGWARRRDDDLARAAAGGFGSPPTRGRPVTAGSGRPHRLLLSGGVAVTAAAAVAVAAVVLAGPPSTGRPGASPHGVVPLSARSFLLASAVKAARAPAATGVYWYVRERDFEPTGGVTKSRKLALPGITYAETQETWTSPVRSRTIADEHLRFRFASVADKARWETAGKPPLMSAAGRWLGRSRPETSNYHLGYGKSLGVGQASLTLAKFRRLPVTAAGLARTLRRMWNSIPDTGGTDSVPDKAETVGLPHPTFADYVFRWADVLLTGPSRPGTRAAIYRLLARQPGVTVLRSVTDPLGRRGVAIADGAGYGGRDYMIISPRTAQILAYTTRPVHATSVMATTQGGVEVYEAMGWTNQIGVPARP